jgi:hypothetical protein
MKKTSEEVFFESLVWRCPCLPSWAVPYGPLAALQLALKRKEALFEGESRSGEQAAGSSPGSGAGMLG